MAKPNDPYNDRFQRPQHPLPEWMRYDVARNYDTYEWQFRMGIKCTDGWIKILDMPAEPDRLHMTKQDLLNAIKDDIIRQLAALELEKP